MAVDPVPYVIHGAKHSADVFRQAFFDATSGAEGVSNPTSLGVKATGTPSNQVRVFPGGVLVPNTYQGGDGQSYTGRNASQTLVDVPASDSTGAKTYYIIFRIQDPQFGGQAPSDPLVGPYAFLECVSTSANITDPHYRLAKVTVPASTSTIQQSMIEDLRSLALPQRQPLMFGRPRVAEDESTTLGWSVADGGEYFPGGNGSPNSFNVFVPEWATRVLFDAAWMSVRYAGGANPHGLYWIEFGDEYRDHTWPGKQQREFRTQRFAFNSPGQSNNVSRTDWRLMTSQHMPKKLRGKEITIVFKAGRQDGGPGSDVQMDAFSGLGMHITFVQTTLDPVTNESPQ